MVKLQHATTFLCRCTKLTFSKVSGRQQFLIQINTDIRWLSESDKPQFESWLYQLLEIVDVGQVTKTL